MPSKLRTYRAAPTVGDRFVVLGPAAKGTLTLHSNDLLSLELLEERHRTTGLEIEVNRAERAKKLRAAEQAIEQIQKELDTYTAAAVDREKALLGHLKQREEQLEAYKGELTNCYGVDFQGDATIQYDDVTGQIFRMVEGHPEPIPCDKKKR